MDIRFFSEDNRKGENNNFIVSSMFDKWCKWVYLLMIAERKARDRAVDEVKNNAKLDCQIQ